MATRRKLRSRTKSGRISRAGKARDAGTPELQLKRQALVGIGADPSLSTTKLDILAARGYLTTEQRDCGIRYRIVRSCLYGSPWPVSRSPGAYVEEARIKAMQAEFNGMVRRLTLAQREAIDEVAVLDRFPMWFDCIQLKLKLLPEDERAHADLISGLEALATGPTRQRKAA